MYRKKHEDFNSCFGFLNLFLVGNPDEEIERTQSDAFNFAFLAGYRASEKGKKVYDNQCKSYCHDPFRSRTIP